MCKCPPKRVFWLFRSAHPTHLACAIENKDHRKIFYAKPPSENAARVVDDGKCHSVVLHLLQGERWVFVERDAQERDLGVVFGESHQLGKRALARFAVVGEKFHDGHFALGIVNTKAFACNRADFESRR
jgi:hypothetical protein